MAVVEELLRCNADGSISFGNHTLSEKAKLDNFGVANDVYKVKTYHEITKLEKNGLFLYESVPGTSVNEFVEKANEMSFVVEGSQDAQITVGLEADANYEVYVDDASVGSMNTNLSGKLNVSVELEGIGSAQVKIVRR